MRERQFNAIVGAPGHGKSTLTAKLVSQLPGNAIIYKTHFNIDDKAFEQFPLVDVKKYTGGKVRFSDANIQYNDLLKWVKSTFRNGTLIIDDATIFEVNQISKELNYLIAMRRHLGIDIYLVYHGLTGFPIDQYKFLNWLILFNTTDSIAYKKSKIPNYNKIEIAIAQIKKEIENGNKYANRAIKLS